MIRRQVGNEFHLFTQNDHALLAGEMAAHFGNARFTSLDPCDHATRAVSLHDCGWPLHDDRPGLNSAGLPLHVFETPLDVALKVWQATTDLVARDNQPDYTQLLVSLHVLGLSGYAASNAHTRFEVFELNKFQHRQIEIQERLRQRLSLSTEIPLKLGLAVETRHPPEEKLRRNHTILQAMDRLSLDLLCSDVVFPKIENVLPRPGAAPVTLTFKRTGPDSMKVTPWPFGPDAFNSEIPYRRVPAEPYLSPEHFQDTYNAAPPELFRLAVHS
jgi:hypothetical protein